MKILLIYCGYPRVSQSYQIDEARQFSLNGHELLIFSCRWPIYTESNQALPYIKGEPTSRSSLTQIGNFGPQLIHGCYLEMLPTIDKLSKTLGIPFTLRAHSYDVLSTTTCTLKEYAKIINGANCRAIITFPSWSSRLVTGGINASKIIECFPSIKIQRYHIPLHTEHGPHIMSGGACLPKKDVYGFIDNACILRQRFPDKLVSFYTMPEDPVYYRKLVDYNISKGSPVIFKTVQTTDMPSEYLSHSWLIYGACKKLRTVGFPLMIAEAQAAGVMVIMYKLRQDAELYLGDSGYFYESADDICDIIGRGAPDPRMLQRAQELTSRTTL